MDLIDFYFGDIHVHFIKYVFLIGYYLSIIISLKINIKVIHWKWNIWNSRVRNIVFNLNSLTFEFLFFLVWILFRTRDLHCVMNWVFMQIEIKSCWSTNSLIWLSGCSMPHSRWVWSGSHVAQYRTQGEFKLVVRLLNAALQVTFIW